MEAVATALLLNYKRADNLRQTIISIRNQNVPIDIVVWNNGDKSERFDCELQIDSSDNLVCFPRWSMAQFAKTKYIFTLDDDIKFKDEKVIEDCIQNYSTKNIIGFAGVNINYNSTSPYTDGQGFTAEEIIHTSGADIIKGRFMFMERSILTNLPLIFSREITREDDIYVSMMTKKRHKVLKSLAGRFVELGRNGTGLDLDPDHYDLRNKFLTSLIGAIVSDQRKTPINRPIKQLESRQNLHMAIDPNAIKLIVEIGVFKGDFSAYLLENFNPERLMLVDPWEGIIHSGDQNGNGHEEYTGDKLYSMVNNRFESWKQIVSLHRVKSTDFFYTIVDNIIDLVYVDGDHSYDGCKKDLIEAFRVVKNGGWIVGHDYGINPNRSNHQGSPGVTKAVDEFCSTFGQTIAFKINDGCIGFAIQVLK